MMIQTFQIIILCLNILNVIFHSVGIYILLSVYEDSRQKVQQIFLLNLSVCECIINLFQACSILPEIISIPSRYNILNDINEHILIISFTGISVVYYLDMIYITVDRMMDIVLNIRYPVYWNERKTKVLMFSTWVIGTGMCVTVIVLHNLIKFKWKDAFFKYFYPTVGFAFIILALITYGFIFHKFKQSRKPPVRGGKHTKSANSITVFRRSRFHIPVFLILTFLLFMIVPDLTYLFVAVINERNSPILLAICWISYCISNLVDAWIYIFMQRDVRRHLWKNPTIIKLVRMEQKARRNGTVNQPSLFFVNIHSADENVKR